LSALPVDLGEFVFEQVTLLLVVKVSCDIAWRSGGYYRDRKLSKPNPLADDPTLAAGLWDRSEFLTQAKTAP
jgi:hypothetical protein